MPSIDITRVDPFEICSIRPPTENYSLTFRLTRNCGWNKCLFCPAYKYGASFSRRSIEEVKRDVDRAKMIHALLMEYGIGAGGSIQNSYQEAAGLIEKISAAKREEREADQSITSLNQDQSPTSIDEHSEEDEQLAWFASWFKEKPAIEDSIYHLLSWHLGGGETCFLGDSNSLILSPAFFAEVVAYIKKAFPQLKRFTIYGRIKSAAKKTVKDLRVFQEAGLSCCVYVMLGLGGARWSKEHAVETATVLTEIAPDYVRLRSLEIFSKTGLSAAVQGGDFVEASEEQTAREIRIMLEQIEAPCVIVSDSASNLLAVNGTLPHDRERMFAVVDEYLALSHREKLAFSLESRLRSFIGQYGGMTHDVLQAVAPYVTDHGTDISNTPDYEVMNAIKLIRSKLMP